LLGSRRVALLDCIQQLGDVHGHGVGAPSAEPAFLASPLNISNQTQYNQLFCDGHVAALNPMVLFNRPTIHEKTLEAEWSGGAGATGLRDRLLGAAVGSESLDQSVTSLQETVRQNPER
jgi:prepilin-type processing-associated H-X9-DG protein